MKSFLYLFETLFWSVNYLHSKCRISFSPNGNRYYTESCNLILYHLPICNDGNWQVLFLGMCSTFVLFEDYFDFKYLLYMNWSAITDNVKQNCMKPDLCVCIQLKIRICSAEPNQWLRKLILVATYPSIWH